MLSGLAGNSNRKGRKQLLVLAFPGTGLKTLFSPECEVSGGCRGHGCCFPCLTCCCGNSGDMAQLSAVGVPLRLSWESRRWAGSFPEPGRGLVPRRGNAGACSAASPSADSELRVWSLLPLLAPFLLYPLAPTSWHLSTFSLEVNLGCKLTPGIFPSQASFVFSRRKRLTRGFQKQSKDCG